MASKSKQKRMKEISHRETATLAVIVAMVAAVFAIIQNSYGQFSDIRGFYQMHFSDGQHLWPFSTHTLLGSKDAMHPVEYPALTGLIMWLLSFFIKPSQLAWVDYFRLTAGFHVVLFGATTYFIKKLASRKWAIVFAISPAVLYSLNRNWDIWAVITMVWAIYLFEKGKEKQSAILLAISIATKFFPLVLFFPILLSCFRNKQIKRFVIYFSYTVGAWVLINLPFALTNFRGWSYFYEFNYSRGIGSASVWDVTSQIGISLPTSKVFLYVLNIGIFALLGLLLLKSKPVLTLPESAFLTMFAFILFNKQYSMQYVIWLAALAVIAIAKLSKKHQFSLTGIYVLWQASELAFQYGFFQNILTSAYANSQTPAFPQISGFTFGVIGVFRYLIAITFTVLLAKYLYDEKKPLAPVK